MINSYFSKSDFMSGANQSVKRINVAGTDNQYTAPLPIGWGENFALVIVAEGASINVDIIIELGDTLPTNYNASDDEYVQYEGYSSPTISIITAGTYRVPISPAVAKYIRVLLDGQTGNHVSSTYITTSLVKISGN